MDYAIPEPALRILYFSAMKAGVLENEALFARLFTRSISLKMTGLPRFFGGFALNLNSEVPAPARPAVATRQRCGRGSGAGTDFALKIRS
jgi:hypothetical protein